MSLTKEAANVGADRNYPYGNKLPLDRKEAFKAGVKGAIKGTSVGAAAGGLISAAMTKDFPIKKTILPTTIPLAVLGAAKMGKQGFKEYQKKDRSNKALSYLPSNEQIELHKKDMALKARANKIYEEIDRLNNADDFSQDDAINRDLLYDKSGIIQRERKDLMSDAIKRGMELMKKKASTNNYEEMVKFAYEDIMAEF